MVRVLRVLRAGVVASSLLAVSLMPRQATAEDVRELKYDPAIDIPVTATTMALIIGSELAKRDIGPIGCRWCAHDAEGRDTLNPFDRGARALLVWNDKTTAARISDLVAFFGAPSFAFGGMLASGIHDDAERKWPIDGLIIAEAVTISLAVNQTVKFIAGRERPFAHFDEPAPDRLGGTTALARRVDENLSFYSGHTTLTFALAGASGTVANLRDYRFAPLLWAGGFTIAAAVGLLRIAADKHYATDVLMGAVMGTAIGIALPLLFHPRRDESPLPPSNVGAGQQVVGFGGAF